jgi:hypothetical protein
MVVTDSSLGLPCPYEVVPRVPILVPMHFLYIIHWLHALIGIPTPYTYRIWVHIWLVFHSPAVMSCCTSLPSFMMMSLACGLVLRVFGMPSVEM